ncbi:MAG: hypothetical protein ACRD2K_04355 [Terriglobales bacterium]
MKRFLILALCLAFAILASAQAKKGTWTGWVSDDYCARTYSLKHDPKYGHTCGKQCLDAGAKMVFVRDEDEEIFQVANTAALKQYADEHVRVTGTVDNGVLTVISASLVKPKK